MKSLKDTVNILINEKSSDISFNKIMFAMIAVSEGEEPKAHLFKDIESVQDLYREWGGFDEDEITDICHTANQLKKNQSIIHKSSDTEYEIIISIK